MEMHTDLRSRRIARSWVGAARCCRAVDCLLPVAEVWMVARVHRVRRRRRSLLRAARRRVALEGYASGRVWARGRHTRHGGARGEPDHRRHDRPRPTGCGMQPIAPSAARCQKRDPPPPYRGRSEFCLHRVPKLESANCPNDRVCHRKPLRAANGWLKPVTLTQRPKPRP